MKKSDEFYQGMAVILGWLGRDRREDSLVEYAMNDNGISLSDLKSAKVASFDLAPITKCLRPKIAEEDYEPTLRDTGFDDPPSLR